MFDVLQVYTVWKGFKCVSDATSRNRAPNVPMETVQFIVMLLMKRNGLVYRQTVTVICNALTVRSHSVISFEYLAICDFA